MPLSATRDIFTVDYLIPKENQEPKQNNLYGVDLAGNGENTQHSTHSLHTYVAAINPPLVEKLIQTYIPSKKNILDPYCGGGGVLVESILSGRDCAGGDINPLAVIISKAKTTYVDREIVIKLGTEIWKRATYNLNRNNQIDVDNNIKFWFKEKNLEELLILKTLIKKLVNSDKKLLPLFQTIFSGTIRDVMLTYRGEVRLRKLREKDYERFNPNAFDCFLKRIHVAARAVSQLPKNIECDVEVRDIRKLPFENNQFYSIICSPPYADDKNGVGYFQFSKNMLYFLDFTSEDVKKHKDFFHGSIKKNGESLNLISLNPSLENLRKLSESKYNEAMAFYLDYQQGLIEMSRVTEKWIIIVIGNRVLGRTAFDNVAITVEIFKNLGINLKDHYTRELRKKRIPNLGSDGGGINLEHVLVFKR